MSKQDSAETTIRLEGDWSIRGIGEQFGLVAEKFAFVDGMQKVDRQLPPAAGKRFTVDLAGVDVIDACGCQLLLILFGNLKQVGMNPALTGIPKPVRDNFQLLGFDREFSAFADDVVEAG